MFLFSTGKSSRRMAPKYHGWAMAGRGGSGSGRRATPRAIAIAGCNATACEKKIIEKASKPAKRCATIRSVIDNTLSIRPRSLRVLFSQCLSWQRWITLCLQWSFVRVALGRRPYNRRFFFTVRKRAIPIRKCRTVEGRRSVTAGDIGKLPDSKRLHGLAVFGDQGGRRTIDGFQRRARRFYKLPVHR